MKERSNLTLLAILPVADVIYIEKKKQNRNRKNATRIATYVWGTYVLMYALLLFYVIT